MTAKIVKLPVLNAADAPALLRSIAKEIEDGDHGEFVTVAVCVFGDELEVYAGGHEPESPSAAVILHAGFMRLTKQIEERG